MPFNLAVWVKTRGAVQFPAWAHRCESRSVLQRTRDQFTQCSTVPSNCRRYFATLWALWQNFANPLNEVKRVYNSAALRPKLFILQLISELCIMLVLLLLPPPLSTYLGNCVIYRYLFILISKIRIIPYLIDGNEVISFVQFTLLPPTARKAFTSTCPCKSFSLDTSTSYLYWKCIFRDQFYTMFLHPE